MEAGVLGSALEPWAWQAEVTRQSLGNSPCGAQKWEVCWDEAAEDPTRHLGLGWPTRVVGSRPGVRPLQPCSDQLPDMGCPHEGLDLGPGSILSPRAISGEGFCHGPSPGANNSPSWGMRASVPKGDLGTWAATSVQVNTPWPPLESFDSDPEPWACFPSPPVLFSFPSPTAKAQAVNGSWFGFHLPS